MLFLLLFLLAIPVLTFVGLAARQSSLRRWRYLVPAVTLHGILMATTIGIYEGDAAVGVLTAVILTPAGFAGIAMSLPYARRRHPD
jgi:hypothetical protein